MALGKSRTLQKKLSFFGVCLVLIVHTFFTASNPPLLALQSSQYSSHLREISWFHVPFA